MTDTGIATLSRFFVSCPGHVEPLLVRELAELVGTHAEVSETRGGVYLDGDLAAAYRACLWSSLAGRVFAEIATDVVEDKDGLYRAAAAAPFETFFTPAETFAVAGHVSHRAFTDSHLPALVVKDAAADRFRNRSGRRPSVDTSAPAVRLYLHLTNRRMRLYLDLSGESLHKRGYRRVSTAAPLRENTAAAVLARAGWSDAVTAFRAGDSSAPFLADPMCGSGTIAIEAVRQALDIAPGLDRDAFGFERLLGHDEHSWSQLLEEATRRREHGIRAWQEAGGRIWASDIDSGAVEATRENAEAAGVAEFLTIAETDFARLRRGALLGALDKSYEPELRLPYFIVTNPPYGRRVHGTGEGAGGSDSVHGRLGRWLAERFTGFRAAVLAASKEQARELGLRAERVNALYNGNLPVVLAVLILDETNRYRAAGRGAAGRRGAGRGAGARAGAVGGDETTGIAMLTNRFAKNMRTLRPYLERESVGSYRLYDADIPQHAAAVDVYTDREGEVFALVQEYAPPKTVDEAAAAKRFAEVVAGVEEFLEIDGARIFTRERRRQRGAAQYRPSDDRRRRTAVVPEDRLLFEINLTDYLDVGLFLDHRLVRRRIGETADGLRFLNLFAYTCSATVHAAAGGAASTVSVDASKTYLAWGKRNLELNGFRGREVDAGAAGRIPSGHALVRADSLRFLEQRAGTYDLMLIDPPTFSNSKSRRHDFDVQTDHVALLRAALARLAPGGRIIFSTNLKSFRLADEVREHASVTDISEETTPPDFARSRKSRHVYVIEGGDAAEPERPGPRP
jgi:23S rRNA (guanine2445-N2)-methyltransferase / 23S rRNA (guanine2069-N7)-methyltransferase